MEETKYISDHNYNPGGTEIPAGNVFTLEQWKACGGKEAGLQGHLDAGYIHEWEGQAAPSAPIEPASEPETQTADLGTEEVGKIEKDEDQAPRATKPTGVWDFTNDELRDLSLEALNGLHKDHAAKYDLKVRAFKDKNALIKKMTSEA